MWGVIFADVALQHSPCLFGAPKGVLELRGRSFSVITFLTMDKKAKFEFKPMVPFVLWMRRVLWCMKRVRGALTCEVVYQFHV